jgi:cytochrome oxidase Cu insertion factor (SCO1/SenC/PrrC family)
MQIRPTPTAFRTGFVLMILAALIMSGCGNGTGDGLAVDDEAPDFALPAASGSIVSLDDYAGTPALLYFHMADG